MNAENAWLQTFEGKQFASRVQQRRDQPARDRNGSQPYLSLLAVARAFSTP